MALLQARKARLTSAGSAAVVEGAPPYPFLGVPGKRHYHTGVVVPHTHPVPGRAHQEGERARP